jgi:hypothetical protein
MPATAEAGKTSNGKYPDMHSQLAVGLHEELGPHSAQRAPVKEFCDHWNEVLM